MLSHANVVTTLVTPHQILRKSYFAPTKTLGLKARGSNYSKWWYYYYWCRYSPDDEVDVEIGVLMFDHSDGWDFGLAHPARQWWYHHHHYCLVRSNQIVPINREIHHQWCYYCYYYFRC